LKSFRGRLRRGRELARPRSAASLTGGWFDDATLATIADRYARYATATLSYATVRDFVDSFEHVQPLATAQGDLKDVQRPWTLKAVLGAVPRGGRVLEIGAGQPYVADLLARLGYEVWVVDPYDGSGNGPLEYEQFRAACPGIRFVRETFRDDLREIPREAFDCIYSISVLEHIPDLDQVMMGMKRSLRPAGLSVHSVDHVHLGRGDAEHREHLTYMLKRFGIPAEELDRVARIWSDDPDTYYLSAESHNRWRGSTPYDDFPMRVCVSVQAVTPAAEMA
jgi:2-polyprenyl-3-methyl-5-hydroxy-6-metoxy-1,4-benzoquinol methylase